MHVKNHFFKSREQSLGHIFIKALEIKIWKMGEINPSNKLESFSFWNPNHLFPKIQQAYGKTIVIIWQTTKLITLQDSIKSHFTQFNKTQTIDLYYHCLQ